MYSDQMSLKRGAFDPSIYELIPVIFPGASIATYQLERYVSLALSSGRPDGRTAFDDGRAADGSQASNGMDSHVMRG